MADSSLVLMVLLSGLLHISFVGEGLECLLSLCGELRPHYDPVEAARPMNMTIGDASLACTCFMLSSAFLSERSSTPGLHASMMDFSSPARIATYLDGSKITPPFLGIMLSPEYAIAVTMYGPGLCSVVALGSEPYEISDYLLGVSSPSTHAAAAAALKATREGNIREAATQLTSELHTKLGRLLRTDERGLMIYACGRRLVRRYESVPSDLLAQQRVLRRRKPKGSISGFNYFAQAHRPEVVRELGRVPTNEVNKAIGLKWSTLSDKARQPYQELAENDLIRYRSELEKLSDNPGAPKPLTDYNFFVREERRLVLSLDLSSGQRFLGRHAGQRWRVAAREEKQLFIDLHTAATAAAASAIADSDEA